MPELPEVETIRRQLEPELDGATVEALEVLDPKWTEPAPPELVERAVEGRRIVELDRRGKYLILALEGRRFLVMHLRMTGNLLLVDPDEPEHAHLRARIGLADGRELRFTDPRRFGRGVAIEGDDALGAYFDARLGVEPLSVDFTPRLLAERAQGRSAPLKSFLLTQDSVAGIGNIYADEALFRASLHPLSPAGSMRAEHAEALHAGIIAALEAGLDHGGASIDDYVDSRGERGAMQDEFLVHRREGMSCPRCGESIRRIVVGGRSTYFCPCCQTRLRRRARRKAAR